MIAAVKAWHAATAALLFFLAPPGSAADDPGAGARELARKTAAFAGRDEVVAIAWRNISSAGPAEAAQARAAFESALKEAGVRTAVMNGNRAAEAGAGIEARVTLSENREQFLLVEELRKGDERQVWMTAWKRAETGVPAQPGISLQKKMVWEQDEPMLDVAFPPDQMLVLSPSNLTLYAHSNEHWAAKASVPVTLSKPWPRDARARLRLNGNTFQVNLPGTLCSGSVEPALAMECKPSDEPWALESGSRAMLVANFAASRNYFDGRVATQNGLRKTLAPFYSAAAAEEQGRPIWLLAMLDGRTQIFDSALEPVGSVANWGSDIAGIDPRCPASAPIVLATGAGDGTSADRVQAFSVVYRGVVPLATAAELPGPVTALWPSGGANAVAIVHDAANGRYEAYVLTLSCGP
jgi:hypothetical protein